MTSKLKLITFRTEKEMKRILFVFVLYCFNLRGEVVTLCLGPYGTVQYHFSNEFLTRVERYSQNNDLLYHHTYCYADSGDLLYEELIGSLGRVEYKNKDVIYSPYSLEICTYSQSGQLVHHEIDDQAWDFDYSEKDEVLLPNVVEPHEYNSRGNITRIG